MLDMRRVVCIELGYFMDPRTSEIEDKLLLSFSLELNRVKVINLNPRILFKILVRSKTQNS